MFMIFSIADSFIVKYLNILSQINIYFNTHIDEDFKVKSIDAFGIL